MTAKKKLEPVELIGGPLDGKVILPSDDWLANLHPQVKKIKFPIPTGMGFAAAVYERSSDTRWRYLLTERMN